MNNRVLSTGRACRFLLVTSMLWLTPILEATYSIVAADKLARQIGSAVTSCVSGASVARVYGVAPGIGGINAQAFSNRQGRDLAVRALEQGFTAEVILDYISSTRYDRFAELRQYGIVTFDRALAFSGNENGFFADSLTFEGERFNYAIQGNILTGPAVLAQTEQGFRQTSCDLADRLMQALEFGALNGEGDSRCRPRSASDAAFIQVDAADGETLLRLDVSGSSQPIRELRALFDNWRLSNPC